MDTKENLILLLSLKLAKGVENQYCFMICDMLINLQQTHELTHQQVLTLFMDNF